ANVLSYQLVLPRAGPNTSRTRDWSSAVCESELPSNAMFTTIVTDNGTPSRSATNSFTVTVNEVNSAPVLPTQTDRTIAELTTLRSEERRVGKELPANGLSYQLVETPAGASISSN